MGTDATHDPHARSWLASAEAPGTDLPLQNLPLGVADGRVAVAIGDQCLDLPSLLDAGLLQGLAPPLQAALRAPRLNPLLSLGRAALRELRLAVHTLLREDQPRAADTAACLRPQASAMLGLPCDIGDYTDFFASLNHARNTFNLFRPGQTFLPNYEHVPIAYHGRSSSVYAAPKDFHRPWGQHCPEPGAPPVYAPSRRVDFEVELGFVVGTGNAHGTPVPLSRAGACLAGVCLLNDWSARDVQAWESQPLGPFLAKNFVTAVSPWLVTMDALEPFRAPLAPRAPGDVPFMPYLDDAADRAAGALDITIDTHLCSAAMRELGLPPLRVSRANAARDLWWTPAQMVAHHTVGGCNLRSGDLLGSGTVSGPVPGSEGSLLELTWGGQRPIELPDGSLRSFLLDGDEVTLSARCERNGWRTIGLGTCRGTVLPAHAG